MIGLGVYLGLVAARKESNLGGLILTVLLWPIALYNNYKIKR